MPLELKVPEIGESITEVQIAEWLKKEGDAVIKDEPLVVIDSEKTTLELPAPVSGTLGKILHQAGDTVPVGEPIARLEAGETAAAPAKAESAGKPAKKPAPKPAAKSEKKSEEQESKPASPLRSDPDLGSPRAASPKADEGGTQVEERSAENKKGGDKKAGRKTKAAETLPEPEQAEQGEISPSEDSGSESQKRSADSVSSVSRIGNPQPADNQSATRQVDNLRHSTGDVQGEDKKQSEGEQEAESPKPTPTAGPQEGQPAGTKKASDGEEEVVPMSMLRRTVARRLVEAKQQMAMLTTFNEVDMTAVQALRHEHQEAFEKRHQVKLGLMSFFVKAAVDALKQFPQLNAEVRDNDIVYHNYFNIGVAIATGRGLVVPALRRAERMSFADIEKAIGDFAARAKDGKLKPAELEGATFTITNGGVFGSLLSTPIINPPQSGILGMHTIQERPVAVQGHVVIRPMMYLALTYDHRIVDGREAVLFLRRIKEAIESPARILLEA